MTDQQASIVVPKIYRTKRRVTHNSKGRAIYSCDRCKLKKRACKRVAVEGSSNVIQSDVPCEGCKKASVPCKTTITRKSKFKVPVASLGLHYRCLLLIMDGLFPHIDVKNIDSLIDLGNSLHLRMPSRDGDFSEEDLKSMEDTSLLITSTKWFKPSMKIFDDIGTEHQRSQEKEGSLKHKPDISQEQALAEPLQETSDALSVPVVHNQMKILEPRKVKQPVSYSMDGPLVYDNVELIDNYGNKHYLGPFSSITLMGTFGNIITSKIGDTSKLKLNKFRENANDMNFAMLRDGKGYTPSLIREGFPTLRPIKGLTRSVMDRWLEVFVGQIHPIYTCFDEEDLLGKYQKLVIDLQLAEKTNKSVLGLPNDEVCKFYSIFLLGDTFMTHNNDSRRYDPVIQSLSHFVEINLSSLLLTPTLAGVQSEFLYGLYLGTQGQKEGSYLLVELAYRQCLTMGYQREALYSYKRLINEGEIKTTFWSIVQQEIYLSTFMGRISGIQLEEINIKPYSGELSALKRSDRVASFFREEKVDLCKLCYNLLQYRKEITFSSKKLLAASNEEKAIRCNNRLNSWISNFNFNLSSLLVEKENPNTDKTALVYSTFPEEMWIRIHHSYYIISLCEPFLLYLLGQTESLTVNAGDPLMSLIIDAVKASQHIIDMILYFDQVSENLEFFDNFSILSLATQCLLITDIIISMNQYSSVHLDEEYLNSEHGINEPSLQDHIHKSSRILEDNIESPHSSVRSLCESTIASRDDVQALKEALKKNSQIFESQQSLSFLQKDLSFIFPINGEFSFSGNTELNDVLFGDPEYLKFNS
ncbi:hypothetical protein PP7435_CHR4-1003 [Komagataella phaffii CBS 7435]|uniref:Xylanolytic transcriptional activator regulatory domain-containing protein n=2 Tax=Komagataella phaffii TaxID=460519 RepID=C4R6L8_KOMPG|nr:Hypothetical protein PAS_chr4_0014 [Komagataella phaffii GS115]AOA65221.1 GQ67_04322T0 [Komagataella phaffii]CAH2451420.1 hypothetical protein BQ9382_C4-5250 [Komagataella phaffii CBS 7435]AOA69915.1 GQ68_04294T0 [Komagataella phaffii GS115]CAY71243.1 Hypothetical protein PAS_chr4_0014 [Komagataella phaffii GS115]CCA41152.1 hypothetical protein PP7435_CHR4-1003 [Komagataella phaffii CBS 7435]